MPLLDPKGALNGGGSESGRKIYMLLDPFHSRAVTILPSSSNYVNAFRLHNLYKFNFVRITARNTSSLSVKAADKDAKVRWTTASIWLAYLSRAQQSSLVAT
jgi:hypothetical protein